MIRLIYISTTRQPHTPAELDQILRVSRRNNAAVGVSGLLIAGGNRFLQVLEGDEAAVGRTYERICGDPRHFATVVLSQRPITERAFGAWDMGFQPSAASITGGAVADDVAALIAPIEDNIVKAYFEEFARKHAA